MTAATIAEMLVAAIEIAKISSLLLSENREPTEQEKQMVRDSVNRANNLWEAVG
ncbi:hypothetical protein IID24_03990 [Patescibacteria group bacterium]|nr:hypothetical protein [Patescibacteria group bacterium]